MENIMNKPVIGVVMCRNRLKGHETQTLQEKYLNAIINAGGLPIALPHGQGARTLGPRLRVEARSTDGLVEAVSVHDHPFALGVQWHPEWNSSEYALSRMLFEGFITACQSHIAEKQRL